MASTVSFPSQPFPNFPLPPSKDSATTTTNHFSSDNLSASSQHDYSFFSTNSFVEKSSTASMESHHHHHHLATETSEMKTTASDDLPKIIINSRTRTDDLATAMNDEEFCEKGETSQKRAPASDDDPAVNMEEQTLEAATTESKKDETLEKKSTASNSGNQPKIKIKLDRKTTKNTNDQTFVATDGNVEEKKRKRTFSVSLTKEEIEADRIAMGLGGLKRSRKIKKRPKSVQKLLDNLFPGTHVKYVTLDDYRVS